MPKRLMLPLIATIAVAGALLVIDLRPEATTASAPLDSEEQAFLNLINQYRQQNGLGALSIDSNLQDASDWMSVDMGENHYFSHTDSLGRDPFQRMRAFGYNWNTWLGENIAAGTSSAQTAFDLWKGSPPHNANMLNPNFKVMGIGRDYTAGSPYSWYWTNDFGGHLVPVPTPAPTPAPTPSPTPFSPDNDGDGSSNAVESHVGTNSADNCGNPDLTKLSLPSRSWPADVSMVGLSANKVDIMDLASFVAPIRRLGTSPGEFGFDQRWDLVPGSGPLSDHINIMDIGTLATLAPPMLGNQRALNGPSCANP